MPRVISNSGGASSGCMTYLEKAKGLGPEDYIIYVNTGLEDNRTLDFLHQQELHWNIKIHWLEYCPYNKFKVVNYHTAARVDWHSEDQALIEAQLAATPFWRLIMRKYLTPGRPRTRKGNGTAELFERVATEREVLMVPNIASKFCTQELKIRVMRDFMRSEGYGFWEMVQGIRADEPRRLKIGKDNKEPRWDNDYPLAKAGIALPDVAAFWHRQPFRLELESYEGNCRYCFEKREDKLLLLIAETPVSSRALSLMEEATRTTFILNNPIARLMRFAEKRPLYALQSAVQSRPAQAMSCFCGD